MLANFPRHQKRAAKIGVENEIVVVGGDSLGSFAAIDSGDVDESIDMPQTTDRGLDRR